EPEPAVLLGDRHAEEPELAHLRDKVGRELVGVLELRGDRYDLAVDPVGDCLDQLGALGDTHTATAAVVSRPRVSSRTSTDITASSSASTAAWSSASSAFSRNLARISSAVIGFSGAPRWCGKSASTTRPSVVVIRTPPGNAAG